MRGVLWTALCLTTLGAAVPAVAQLAPDTPRLISPHASGGLGVHQLRANALPDDGSALLVTWAMPGLPPGVRWRAATGRGAEGASAAMVGADVQTPLHRASEKLPIDLDWQSGIGVSSGAYTLVTMPVGLSGGIAWSAGGVWLAPYANAGISGDWRLGDDAPTEEFSVSGTFDVGLDLSFGVERTIVLRTAAALGQRKAVTLGLVFGLGPRQ
jgi:hypothetical protein